MTNKERFKKNVRGFEFEPHSFCNRKCWFCPNSFIDRTGPVEFMDQAMFIQVLSDLASINYSEFVSFVGWCEPFSQPSFLDRISEASDSLPNAFLATNSNTDYLTTEVVSQAADNGLHLIRAQLYFDKDEEYTPDAISQKFMLLEAKLPGIEFVEKVGQWYALVNGKMLIHVQAKNFKEMGINRCDVPTTKVKKRYHTCYEGVQYFGINYNGKAIPCCHIRSDYPPHETSLLGQVDSEPGKIFDLYQGVILSESQYPCLGCSHPQSHANVKIVYTEILKEMQRCQTLQQQL